MTIFGSRAQGRGKGSQARFLFPMLLVLLNQKKAVHESSNIEIMLHKELVDIQRYQNELDLLHPCKLNVEDI